MEPQEEKQPDKANECEKRPMLRQISSLLEALLGILDLISESIGK